MLSMSMSICVDVAFFIYLHEQSNLPAVSIVCCTIKFSTNRRDRAPSRHTYLDASLIERHLGNYILGANQCLSLLRPVLGITR